MLFTRDLSDICDYNGLIMDKKTPFLTTRFFSLLLLLLFAASCSLPDPRNLNLFQPQPTATPTLEPGAPDVTQMVVKEPAAEAGSPTQAAPTPASLPAATVVVPDVVIYEDTLAEGWQNWSWDTQVDLKSAAPAFSGSLALSAQIDKSWAAVYLHTDNPISTQKYTALRFWIHGGEKGGQRIAFKAINAYNKNWEKLVEVLPVAGEWSEVTVPLERLGSPEEIGALVWQDNAGQAQPTFSIDGVTLLGRTGPLPTPLPPLAGPALTIDAQAARKTISPYIYGMNFASEELAAELRLPVRRWGGNATTLYNFKLDVHNTGSDWYFENIPEYNSNPAALPDGSSVDRTIDQDRLTGTQSIITIPLIGWTPKRRVENHPYDCSYKVSKYGPQESVDGWDEDCGNGKDKNGKNITNNDPNDAYMPVTTAYIQEWVAHLVGKYGTAADGGVMFYNLDNEPMLWPYTHRDVHPQMTTYDEVRDATFKYAAALKEADPTAQTLGPVLWGWCAYRYSALDDCKPGEDYKSHGNMGFVEWYLQQMAAYEEQHGVRLLDYLDLHIYPQAQGVMSGSQGDPDVQALRLRSTRSLWDPTYVDESWIKDSITLIPRMREWVNAELPRHEAGDHRVLLGGEGQAQRRPGPGRYPRHFRARGPRPGYPVGPALGGGARGLCLPHVPEL